MELCFIYTYMWRKQLHIYIYRYIITYRISLIDDCFSLISDDGGNHYLIYGQSLWRCNYFLRLASNCGETLILEFLFYPKL